MSLSQYVLVGLAALGALALGAAYFGQRRLIYYPDTVHSLPSEAGLAGVEERVLKTPDGARVVAWYGKAKPGQPTILYFHGNAGSLANRAPRIERFMGEGWGVYMMTYRGYGGGTGKPTEAHNVADARLAYGALVHEGVEPSSIILYGESLGTGIAVRLAAERQVAGVVLDAPYTSLVDVAAGVYPFLPVRLALADRYEFEQIHQAGACAAADPARRARRRDPGGDGTRAVQAGERAQAPCRLPQRRPQRPLPRRQWGARGDAVMGQRAQARNRALSQLPCTGTCRCN